MEQISGGEAAGYFAGLVALMAALGKGLAAAVGWVDRNARSRDAKLAAWEESLARREVDMRQRTEGRLAAVEHALTEVRSVLAVVTIELRKHSPNNAVLDRAEAALGRDWGVGVKL